MTFGEMISLLRTPAVIEIRDEDNHKICVTDSNSRGCAPYLNCEVTEWFVYGISLCINPQPDMCVLLKLNDNGEKEAKEC